MPEREPQTSEQVNLHERGGLTPEHWQFLSKIKFKDNKINRFASALNRGVINGDIETHRQYLGQRHWREISNTAEIKLNSALYILVRKIWPDDYVTTRQVKGFASREANSYLTLDDFILSRRLNLRINIPDKESQWLMWNEKSSQWHHYREAYLGRDIKDLRYVGWWDEGETVERMFKTVDLGVDRSSQADKLIAAHFELTSEELPCASSSSPEAILDIARNTIADGDYLNRVIAANERDFQRRLSFSRLAVYGWEKEI